MDNDTLEEQIEYHIFEEKEGIIDGKEKTVQSLEYIITKSKELLKRIKDEQNGLVPKSKVHAINNDRLGNWIEVGLEDFIKGRNQWYNHSQNYHQYCHLKKLYEKEHGVKNAKES